MSVADELKKLADDTADEIIEMVAMELDEGSWREKFYRATIELPPDQEQSWYELVRARIEVSVASSIISTGITEIGEASG